MLIKITIYLSIYKDVMEKILYLSDLQDTKWNYIKKKPAFKHIYIYTLKKIEFSGKKNLMNIENNGIIKKDKNSGWFQNYSLQYYIYSNERNI